MSATSNPNDVNVEEYYQAAIAKMTPAEKIERACALNAWGRWNLERRITEELGPQSPEVMKWRVALRVYGQNPVCRQMIEEQLARVSNR